MKTIKIERDVFDGMLKVTEGIHDLLSATDGDPEEMSKLIGTLLATISKKIQTDPTSPIRFISSVCRNAEKALD